MRSQLRPIGIALTLGLPVALPVLWLTARHGFDGLYGQDPYAYFDYAVGPLRESLGRFGWPPPFFWPPGYPLLVALASVMLGPVPAAARLVSLIAGCAVPGLTYLLARELPLFAREVPAEETTAPAPAALPLGETAALLAGLLAALTPQLWQSSAVIMADTTGLGAATAGAVFLARHQRSERAPDLLLAAGLTAFAVLTRWAYALVALPFTVLALLQLRRRATRSRLLHATGAAAIVLVVLAPILVSGARTLANEPAEATETGGGFLGDLHVYSWNPANAWGRKFETTDGELSYPTPNGWFYLSAPARRAFFTPVVALLLLPGLWLAVRTRDAPIGWLLVAWPAVLFGFHAGAPWQNFRFTLALLPPLAILAAAGAVSLLHRARGVDRPRLRTALTALLAVGVTTGMLWMTREAHELTERFMTRKADSLATAGWVERTVEPNALVLVFGLTLTLDHYTALETRDLYLLDPDRLVAELPRNRPTYLLADESSLLGQWRDAAPGVCFRALRDGPGLEPLGRRGAYTLSAVRPRASSR